ncbi:MAG: SEC-C domain-containing protein [Anaerolineae bacterium]|nr:SEC-C domain-containing protein [Anaerolineae bacterium]
MDTPGRNDPCYCGSGKKYKQCHLKEDQARESERRARQEAVRYIRRDLLKFARDERFNGDFAKALPQYWNEFYTFDNAEEMSQPEALRFFDWFVFDYTLSDGQRLINLYYDERREDLSTHQQAALDEWRQPRPAGAYELTGYEGQTLFLRDYLTGEEFTVYDAGGRGIVEIGEVILARLAPVLDRLEFSTNAAYLPAAEIQDVKDKMLAAEAAYQQEHPDATHEQFMREKNTLLIHHALAQAEVQRRPPVARLDPDREDKKTQKVVRQMKRLKR